jgi:hypothetical protein
VETKELLWFDAQEGQFAESANGVGDSTTQVAIVVNIQSRQCGKSADCRSQNAIEWLLGEVEMEHMRRIAIQNNINASARVWRTWFGDIESRTVSSTNRATLERKKTVGVSEMKTSVASFHNTPASS